MNSFHKQVNFVFKGETVLETNKVDKKQLKNSRDGVNVSQMINSCVPNFVLTNEKLDANSRRHD